MRTNRRTDHLPIGH